MRKFIKVYAIDTYSLYLASQVASGLVFENGLKTLLLAGVGLTVASHLAKPIINMLLLPLNLVTFGLFRWISSAIALYLVTLIIRDFGVSGFVFGGFSASWTQIPAFAVSGFLAFIAFSLLISTFASFIRWIVK